jgi:hypothetical protein
LFLAVVCAAGMVHAQGALDCHLAPGWEPAGPVRAYTAENLYEYKDGAADGYLIYGFTRMSSLDCKSGGDTLTIDVSEMNDASSAWGIFSANFDSTLPLVKLGMAGQVGRQSANFVKGNYYAELVVAAANPNDDDAALLQSFARAMLAHMQGSESLPEPLAWFDHSNQTSVRLVPESVLGLRLLKRGYVAKYTQGQAFIVQEASPESAAEVMKKLREHFEGASPAKIGDEAFTVKAPYLDGICIFRKGRFLAGYANLPAVQEAAAQAAKLAVRIP